MIERIVRITFPATNSMAEHEVVVLVLKELNELGAKHISMHNESRLVVNQVMGTFETSEENINNYLTKIKE